MKKTLILLLAVAFILLPIVSFALTREDVLKLVELGIPEEVIIEKIETSGDIFTLGADDERELKAKGVSDKIIDAMKATAKRPSITIEDIRRLCELDIPEDVIIDKIRDAGVKFVLTDEEKADLRAKGASEKIINASMGILPAKAVEKPAVVTKEEGVANNLLIILDSSGSMNEETRDRKQKLEAAKVALSNLVDTLPTDLNVGLIVYGHRREDDCSDIEMMVPVEPLNKTAIKSGVGLLQPKGQTPIAASLEIAGQTLKGIEGESSIILISDGKETCGGDPVTVASRLAREYGIKVIVDVIGFDVTAAEQRQLEAIAKAGGGKYYSAATAGELELATAKAVKKRVIKKKVVKAGLGVLVIDAKAVPWLTGFVGHIYDQETDEEIRSIYLVDSYYEGNPPHTQKVRLKPGIYKIVFDEEDYPMEIEDIEIAPGEENVITLEE